MINENLGTVGFFFFKRSIMERYGLRVSYQIEKRFTKDEIIFYIVYKIYSTRFLYICSAAVVAQSVRALAQQAYGWAFESQPRQT